MGITYGWLQCSILQFLRFETSPELRWYCTACALLSSSYDVTCVSNNSSLQARHCNATLDCDLSTACYTQSPECAVCVVAATCSQYGVCLSSVSTTATNTAPSIALHTTAALPSTVNVKQYSTYAACASGVAPTTALLCELGAIATDIQDGTLTSVINSCAPSKCTSTSTCSGTALGCLLQSLHDLRERQTCLSDCQLCPLQAKLSGAIALVGLPSFAMFVVLLLLILFHSC